jgi:hypothetical protein
MVALTMQRVPPRLSIQFEPLHRHGAFWTGGIRTRIIRLAPQMRCGTRLFLGEPLFLSVSNRDSVLALALALALARSQR